MSTVVSRKRELSSSAALGGKYSKSELWQVLSDTITEPEFARDASGLPELGELLPNTAMRCSKKRAELEQISADGLYVWNVAIDYDSPDSNTHSVEPRDGTELWTINGQMQQETVKKALFQEKMGDSVDVGKFVGVKDDGTIEGFSWGVPVTTLSVTLYKNRSNINGQYITGCVREIGNVNSGDFYGFAAGEVRLDSINIPKKLETLWALQFDFAIQRNEKKADLPSYDGVGGKTFSFSRDVKGWEYTWLKNIESADSTGKTKTLAEGLYIARNFTTTTFAVLGLSGRLF